MSTSSAKSAYEIELDAVEKRFTAPDGTVHAVATTSLNIGARAFVVLLGPSGCGKTTLLRMAAGLIRPSAGEVRVRGRSLWSGETRDDAAVQDLGIVFQDANLFPWLSIAENIALPLALRGVAPDARQAKVSELMSLVGIAGFEKRWPRELSGGMRQRAAIARALSYDPEILLMDEPFGALDALTRDQMNLEIQRISASRGSTVLFVTHAISEAVFLADRVIVLSPRPGRISASIDVTFPRPRDLDLQSAPAFQDIVRDLRHRLEGMA